jgi:hypothetical protein
MSIRHKVALLLTALLLALLWGLCLLLECFAILFSTYPQAYPFAILIGSAIAYPALRKAPLRSISLTLLIAYTIAILTLDFTTFHLSDQARPFMLFYRDVHPGMGLAQVYEALDRQFPSNGRFPKPVCGDRAIAENKIELSCQLDPNSSAYNAEFITVRFTGDRVTYKNYSPD